VSHPYTTPSPTTHAIFFETRSSHIAALVHSLRAHLSTPCYLLSARFLPQGQRAALPFLCHIRPYIATNLRQDGLWRLSQHLLKGSTACMSVDWSSLGRVRHSRNTGDVLLAYGQPRKYNHLPRRDGLHAHPGFDHDFHHDHTRAV
jgi:hypothetical protein